MKNYQGDTKEDVDLDVLVEVKESHKIILYNDDVNTFEHVIEVLIAVCEHEPIQAEQCAYIVHYKGKCDVQSGEYEELEIKCTALLDKGLTAEIV